MNANAAYPDLAGLIFEAQKYSETYSTRLLLGETAIIYIKQGSTYSIGVKHIILGAFDGWVYAVIESNMPYNRIVPSTQNEL